MTVRPIFIPPVSSVEELRQVLTQQLQGFQQYLVSQFPQTTFGGVRLSGIGSPQQPGDAVTLGYLQANIIPRLGLGGNGNQTTISSTNTIDTTLPVDITAKGNQINY